MGNAQVYAVFLTDDAVEELGKSFSLFIRNKGKDSYIYAKSVDSSGNYFQVTVVEEIAPGEKVELELQLPHEFIKASLGAADANIKELGFS
jgi:hypothetical protein